MFNEVKDSGNRRTFETGAVRDMQEGKGRYDLIPPEMLRRLARHYENGAKKYSDRNWEKGIPISSLTDSAIRHLMCFLLGLNDEDHLAAVIWNITAIIFFDENMDRYPNEMYDLPWQKELMKTYDD